MHSVSERSQRGDSAGPRQAARGYLGESLRCCCKQATKGTIVTPRGTFGHYGMCSQNVNGSRILLEHIVLSLGVLFERLGADIGKSQLSFQFHMTRCS